MKDIKTYLTESDVTLTVEYAGFSKEDMVADYEAIHNDGYDTTLKKTLAAKYGINTKKAKEIELAILDQLREYRKRATEFDETDMKMFHRYDSSIKKLIVNEGTSFLLYMKDRYYERLEKRNLIKKLHLTKGRDWNYHMTGADKNMIDSYLAIVAELENRDVEKIATKRSEEELLDVIKLSLIEQTKEFHDDFINDATKYAERIYDNAPNVVSSCEERLPELRKEREDVIERVRAERGWRYYNDSEYLAIDKRVNDCYKKLTNAKAILRKSKSTFVKEIIDAAEDTFNRNITTLASRIMNQDFDFDKLEVTSISDDPKYFELQITDGKNNLYARSIYAAEFSEKMVPHFRFIITNKRKK